MVCLIVDIAKSDENDLETGLLAVLIGVLSGGYALTGYYPNSFPMPQVFCKIELPIQPSESAQ
jgi:hypothetical protein